MKKNVKKFFSLALAATMVVSLAACGNDSGTKPQNTNTPVPTKPADVQNTPVPSVPVPEVTTRTGITGMNELDVLLTNSLEYGKDYVALYEKVGAKTTIADVKEDPDTGLAMITVDGKDVVLGLDFLSWAMVYNTEPAGSYKTSDDVYAAWFKYYITRWNSMLPEIPLYSNEYYDLYNSKIEGTTKYPTNPYWSVPNALIDWTSTKTEKDIIIGSSTELSGQFRYSTFGKSSPGASDNDINGLIDGLETVSKNKQGGYEWNPTVVKDHKEVINADGSKTFTITIVDDLKYSDGSAITAKDYVAFTLSAWSPVFTQASGREIAANTVVGASDFQKYTGPNSEAGVKYVSGLRILDTYTFSVQIAADFIPYFYDITYASFGPSFIAAWCGEADIKDDGQGVYFTDNFYEKNAEGKYVVADIIKATATDTSDEAFAKYPYSGPYCVKSFDKTDATAVLVKNPYFKGNYEGVTPKIEKIVYKKIVAETQLEDFKNGGLDVIAGITGGKETDEALRYADGSNGAAVYTHYSRAGYGKLGFRADFGPVQFQAVRQAIAFCMDRAKFAKDFTGGYGGVVDGPYYTGSWMYKEAVKQGMILDAYATSADSAIEVLVADGWVYAADGTEYKSGVRYKKIPGDLIAEADKTFKSVDGKYKTEKVGDDYYMPLVLNWFGTSKNEFTDLLQTGFKENDNIKKAGFAVYNYIGDFAPMLDELYQAAVYGYYAGTPMYTCFNFATGFNSAVYDYSYNLTIDPKLYDDYSQYYIKDYADIYWISK